MLFTGFADRKHSYIFQKSRENSENLLELWDYIAFEKFMCTSRFAATSASDWVQDGVLSWQWCGGTWDLGLVRLEMELDVGREAHTQDGLVAGPCWAGVTSLYIMSYSIALVTCGVDGTALDCTDPVSDTATHGSNVPPLPPHLTGI